MIYTTCLKEIFHHRFPYFRFFFGVHRHLTLHKKKEGSDALDSFTTSVFTSKLRSKTGRLTLTAHSKVLCETKDVTASFRKDGFSPPQEVDLVWKTCWKKQKDDTKRHMSLSLFGFKISTFWKNVFGCSKSRARFTSLFGWIMSQSWDECEVECSIYS